MFISVYVLLMLISLLVSLMIYRSEPSRPAFWAMWVWISSLISFFSQGLSETTGLLVPQSIGATLPLALVTGRLLGHLFDCQFRRIERTSLIFFAACAVASAALQLAGAGREVVALPIALATGLPFIAVAVAAWRAAPARSSIDTLLLINVMITGLHILDFPFLRFKPEMVMFGFSIAFFNAFMSAILLPVAVNTHIRMGYEATLKDAVRKATDELARKNEDLVEAKNEIQNLLRVVCHDISNSLMVADFSVGKSRKVLSDQDPTHGVLASLDKAASATANVRSLVENVRFLQKFSSQNVPVKLESLRINDLVDTSIGLLSLALQEKSITVNRDIGSNEPVLGVKTYAVNSVLNNVLSNAIKFSYLGAAISIKSYDQDPFVVVEISDRGIGITPEALPFVFSPAQSLSTVGTAGEVGTGFGLPIVKAVMEIMKGQVEIHTRHKAAYPEDHGTTVVLKFRMARHQKKNENQSSAKPTHDGSDQIVRTSHS